MPFRKRFKTDEKQNEHFYDVNSLSNVLKKSLERNSFKNKFTFVIVCFLFSKIIKITFLRSSEIIKLYTRRTFRRVCVINESVCRFV